MFFLFGGVKVNWKEGFHYLVVQYFCIISIRICRRRTLLVGCFKKLGIFPCPAPFMLGHVGGFVEDFGTLKHQTVTGIDDHLGGGFKHFLFSSLFGEDFPFDSYFSDGWEKTTNQSLMVIANSI